MTICSASDADVAATSSLSSPLLSLSPTGHALKLAGGGAHRLPSILAAANGPLN
jgi:hypothetical protein